MAVRSLGQLTLDLVTRTGGFTGPLDKAARHTKKTMANIVGDVRNAASAVTATGAAASAAAAGFLVYAKSAADNARELRTQAQVANTSVEQLQRLSYGSKTVGVEQEKLSDILKDVNDRVGDFLATGGGPMADFFENVAPKIGVTAEEFRNLSGPQALQLYFDSLQRANLSQEDMTFYLEAMASDTTKLIPLLRDGGAGFREMADEADQLGIVLTELDIAKLDEFAGQFDRITGILSSMGQVIAGELSPYLSVLADNLVDTASDTDNLRESFSSAFRSAVEYLGPLLDELHELQKLNARVKVLTADMELGFARFAQNSWESFDWLVDNILGGVNKIIEGMNSIPGFTDLDLVEFDLSETEFFGRFEEQYERARENLLQARSDLEDVLEAPSPSEGLTQYLDEVDRRVGEIEASLGRGDSGIFKTLEQWMLKAPPSGGGGDGDSSEQTEAAREATRELERQQEAYRGLLEELYPVEAMQQQYLEQQQLLAAAYEQGEISAARYADALDRLKENQRSDQEPGQAYDILNPSGMGMDEEEGGYWEQWLQGAEEAFTDFDELAGNTIDNFSSRFGDAFESVIFDAKSLGEATRGVFEGMARSVVNALGEMAAQWLAYQAVQAATQSMATTAQTAAVTQAAATGTSIASAYAPAAAMASLASFGGNAAAATAGITATTAVAEGMALAGMAHDGIDSVPETGTWLLQEGERVTTSETSDKLDRTLDRVIAGQESGGRSGGPLQVNVRNEGEPMAVRRVDDRFEGDQRIIDVVLANVSGEQELHDLITTKYNLGSRGD